MCMSNIERRCRELFSRAVRLRDKSCQVCGAADPECHHLILLSQDNWPVRYDIDFGIALCAEDHRLGPNAPHASPEKFRDEVLDRLLNSMSLERAAKLSLYLMTPEPSAPGRPDFKAIRNRLKEEIRELEDDWFYDADIDQVDIRRRQAH